MTSQNCVRWDVNPSDLVELTPLKARDLIAKCLYEAQRETFAENELELGHTPSDSEIRELVEGAIRLAFREAYQDYDNPTREGLTRVVKVLARKSKSWGTPDRIIEHHKRQIEIILRHLG